MPEVQNGLVEQAEKDEVKRIKKRDAARRYRASHSEHVRKKRQEQYRKNPEKVREQTKAWVAAHPGRRAQYSKKWRTEHPEESKEDGRIRRSRDYEGTRIRAHDKARTLRQEVITAYGGACACCGTMIQEFLAIDHKNGGGRKHRKEIGRGKSGGHFYWWLKRNNWPRNDFQILCHDCNSAKGLYGECPHLRMLTPIDIFLGRTSSTSPASHRPPVA